MVVRMTGGRIVIMPFASVHSTLQLMAIEIVGDRPELRGSLHSRGKP